MILLFVLYFLFGSAFTFGKIAVSYINPLFFIGMRMTLAGALLLGYEWYREGGIVIRRQDWMYFFQIMLFNIFIAYTLEFWALQFVTAAKASLIYNLSPFITAFIAHFFIHEWLTLKQWIGLFIGCAGLVPILLNQGVLEQFSWHIGFVSAPELLLVASVACASYGWIVMKKLMKRHAYSPMIINGVTMLVGGLLSFATNAILGGSTHLKVYDTSLWGLSPYATSMLTFLSSTAALILVANIAGFNLYGYLLNRYSATFISFAGFTTPLFTALLDWLLLGEIVPLSFFVSIGLIVVGLYIFYLDEFKQKN